MSDIFDVLKTPNSKPYNNMREAEESATSSRVGSGPPGTATGETYPPASSAELAMQAQELRRSAIAQSQRIQSRLKQNEEERRELQAELERISDLVGRLEERNSVARTSGGV